MWNCLCRNLYLYAVISVCSGFHYGIGRILVSKASNQYAINGDSCQNSDEKHLSTNNEQHSRQSFLKAFIGIANGVCTFSFIQNQAIAAVPFQMAPLISTPVTLRNRSPFEMQYEMFKNGMELEDDENFEAAERQWTEVIEELDTPMWREGNPGNKLLLARAHANRGGARASLGKQREAILDYSAALTLAPNKCEFWLSRGLAYEGLADKLIVVDKCAPSQVNVFFESALSDYDRALVLDPTESAVHVMRGDVLTTLQENKDALESYRRALALGQGKLETLEIKCKVALAEIQCGNLRMGNAMVNSILSGSPERPDMLLAAAALAWEDGNFADSNELYKMAISRDGRLLDDEFIINVLRWPAVPVSMVRVLRIAGVVKKLATVHKLNGEAI